MNVPVNVLAVLDREILARDLAPSEHAVGCVEHPPGARFPCSCNGPQLIATRAAVAELIAAADEVAGTITVEPEQGTPMARLDAALASVQGGKA